jgi:AraC-like DNA-binding protein
MSADVYVSSSSPRVICHYLLEQRVSQDKLEAIIHAPIESLDSENFRLAIEHYNHLWEYALNISQKPNLGLLLGCRKNDDEIGLLSHIFFSNATIEKALNQYQRYFCVTNENVSIDLVLDENTVQIQFICKQKEFYSLYDMERTLAAGVTRTRERVTKKLPLLEAGFQHCAPAHKESYEKVFHCPIKFSQPCCYLTFDKKYLSYRLPHRSSYLQKVLSKHLDTLLSAVTKKKTFPEKVEALIAKRLSTDSIDAAHISKQLNMSRNTLYRKLQNEGLAFHELVDKVRKRRALELLESQNHSISHIAFLLGFSELSAFSRAFKRWTGSSPAKYLEQITKNA